MPETPFLRISCLELAEAAAAEHQAEIVISILSDDMRAPSFPAVLSMLRHKSFYFHDQESKLPAGMEDAVRDLVQLGQSWKGAFPKTLVHCHGGISRSTAAAYILLCASSPSVDPSAHFENLLCLAPKAWPNLRMVVLADEFLKTGGRMAAPLKTYRDANPGRLDAFYRLNRRRGIGVKVPR